MPIGAARLLTLFPPRRLPFDFYVDSVRGNDSWSGRSPTQPFASLAPLASVASKIKRGVGFARGSTWRPASETSIVLNLPAGGTSNRIVYGAYGSGAAPRILGSNQFSSGSWTNVSGNEWKISANSKSGPNPGGSAPAIAWIAANGTVTPLYKGTSGSLTANQWVIASNELHVNIGREPIVTDLFEVGWGTSYCIGGDKSHVVIQDLFLGHSGGSCVQMNTGAAVEDVIFLRNEIAYPAADGVNFSLGTATGLQFFANHIHHCWNDGGGGGDAISCHGGGISSGRIENNLIERCDKFGIANFESSADWYYINNVLRYANLGIGTNNSAFGGTNYIVKNRIMFDPRSSGAAVYYALKMSTLHSTSTCNVWFNSLYAGTAGLSLLRGMQIDGGIYDIRNNCIEGSGYQIGMLHNSSASLTNNYNNVHTSGNYSGLSAGANDKNVDPLYTDAANGDLSLQALSTLRAAGIQITPWSGVGPDIGWTGAT